MKYYLYIYYTLSAVSKSNFEPLFDFIKNFRKYLKHSMQNSLLKQCTFPFPHFHNEFEMLNVLKFCESTLYIPTVTTGSHLGSRLARANKLTDLSRCKYSR